MKQDLQFKLQAYLDGELSSSEAKAVAAWVAQEVDTRALLAELANTRNALAGFEPETREFYWSKIARDIQRQEKRVSVGSPASILTLLRRLMVPSGIMVALLMGMLVIKQQLGVERRFGVAETDTAQVDAGTFTFRDFASGTTLVWLSYPAENEFAENGSAGTINWE
jgi:anti-sigma factor RsiW